MRPSATELTPAALRLELAIPADTRLLEAVRRLTVLVARHVGYSMADAEAVGAAVGKAASEIVERALGRDPERSVAISFSAGAEDLEVEFRYAAAATLPLDDLRRVMPRVDINRESGTSVCRLRRPLP